MSAGARDWRSGPPFVGREAEIEVLAAAIRLPDPGPDGVVVVSGEAGIGKSALLDEALRRDGVPGVRRSAAQEMESHRPFGLLIDAFSPRRRSGDCSMVVATLLDTASKSRESAAELPFRVTEAVTDLVTQEALSHPVVLVLEDLHWADPASLLVINRLLRAVDRKALRLICSHRPSLRTQELDRLLAFLGDRRAAHLSLGPLPPAEWPALVAGVLEAPPGLSVMRWVGDAGGNPLFIVELLAALSSEGAIALDDEGRAQVRSQVSRPSLTDTILRRLRVLDPDTRHVLRLASILGAAFSVPELMLVADRTAASLTIPLQEAVDAGVLGDAEDRLVFRHEMIRAALYHDIPSALRAPLHAEVARALARSGAPANRVAAHLLLGATPGDEEAVAWLVRAAEEAAPQSPPVAVELADKALTIVEPSDPVRTRLAVLRAVALIRAGRVAEGERACRQALSRQVPTESEGALRFCLAQATLTLGDLEGARREADAAVASPGLTAQERARFSAWASLLPLTSGQLEEAQAAAVRAEEEADAVDDDPARVRAITTRTHVAYTRGRQTEAEQLAFRAVAIAESDGSLPSYESVPDLVQSMVLVDGDRLGEAAEAVARGRRAADRFGDQSAAMFSHIVAAYGPFVAGDWDDALVEIETGLALAVELGAGSGQVVSLSMAALIALRRGGPEAARPWLGRAEVTAAGGGYRAVWLPWVEAACLAAQRRGTEALEVLGPAWEGCQQAGVGVEHRVLGPTLVALALTEANTGLAQKVSRVVEDLARESPEVASLQGAARWCRGLTEGDADALLDAVRCYQRSPRRPDQAATAADAAEALSHAGRMDEAMHFAEVALGQWESVGAVWEASRARARLRQAGVRLGMRGTRRRPTEGWSALSPTERKVAAMLADRLSNPEIAARMFISRRTVETHVSHILAKLSLNSRAELFGVELHH